MSREKELRAGIKELSHHAARTEAWIAETDSRVAELGETAERINAQVGALNTGLVDNVERVAALERRVAEYFATFDTIKDNLRRELEEFIVGRQWATEVRPQAVIDNLTRRVLALEEAGKSPQFTVQPTWTLLVNELRIVAAKLRDMATKPSTDRYDDGLNAAASVLLTHAEHIERNHP